MDSVRRASSLSLSVKVRDNASLTAPASGPDVMSNREECIAKEKRLLNDVVNGTLVSECEVNPSGTCSKSSIS